MGKRDDGYAVEEAAEQAIRLAEARALPVAAFSLSTDAVGRTHRMRQRLVAVLAVAGLALFALVVLSGIGDGINGRGEAVEVISGGLVLAAAAIFLGLQWRKRRRLAYRDPQLRVEVGADGLIVTGPDGAYGQRWSEVEANVQWASSRHGGIVFVGLWLQSPLGTVDLRDDRFRDGRAAAAAIVAGMNAARLGAERAKVEQIG